MDPKTNILIIQQVRNAWTDIVKLIREFSDHDPIKIIMFDGDTPGDVLTVERDENGPPRSSEFLSDGSLDTIPYVNYGMHRLYFYFDITCLSYKVKSNYHLGHNFIFSDEFLERSRQILEIANSIHIHKYYGSSNETLQMLVDRFTYLTENDTIGTDPKFD